MTNMDVQHRRILRWSLSAERCVATALTPLCHDRHSFEELAVCGIDIYIKTGNGMRTDILKRRAQADSLDTALEIVNANAHGNGTAIFTRSGAAARKFQDEVQVRRAGSTAGRTRLVLC